MEGKKKSGLATAGMVLGIVGICTSFIPIINNVSFLLGILALIFGIISIIKKASTGKCITAIILGILSIFITIGLQNTWSKSLNQVSNDLDKLAGNSTEEVLKNDIDVNLGEFQVIKGEYYDETKMVVKLTNKTSETKSFNIQIEAVDSNGARINNDYIYANNLGAGQSQNFEIFTYVSSDKLESMKKATFKIVEASVY